LEGRKTREPSSDEVDTTPRDKPRESPTDSFKGSRQKAAKAPKSKPTPAETGGV
jgi:hypothetical protein